MNWRCFHCGDEFTDAALAEQHFGRSEYQQPACQINVAEYRAMEERMRRYCDEDTDLHRYVGRMQSDHHTALLREEEKGYARGLRDAETQGCVVIPDALHEAALQEAAAARDGFSARDAEAVVRAYCRSMAAIAKATGEAA